MKLMIKAAAIGLAVVALGACTKKTDVNENVVANSTDNTTVADMNATTTNVTTTNATDMNAAAPAATTTNTTTMTTNSSGNAM